MSKPQILVIVGTGRCGLRSIRKLLNEQPSTHIIAAAPPFLPWCPDNEDVAVRRIERLFLNDPGAHQVVGETNWFSVSYAERMLEAFPTLKMICIKRPKQDTVDSFTRWVDNFFPIPTNLWAKKTGNGWYHDPVLTRSFPQFDEPTLGESIGRYWEAYHETSEKLDAKSDRFQLHSMENVLRVEEKQRSLLTFAGYDTDDQVIRLDIHENKWDEEKVQDYPRRRLAPNDPKKCAILVPTHENIPVACERPLIELERRGYIVRRLPGFAAIDQARNVLATHALLDGFEETMWIDSDIEFHPDDIEKLRAHNLPISSGVYAKKGKRAIASHLLPGTESIDFGKDGRRYEIMYAGTGFLHVRREVYEQIQRQLKLPVCNELFDESVVPFFMPLIRETDDSQWYLAEDYVLTSHRVRQVGYKIIADTTIRLWHLGTYPYGWEDAGRSVDRYRSTTIQFGNDPHSRQKATQQDNR